MGFLGEVAARFKRTRFKNVQTLAEEIFSAFSSALDIQPQSITINQPSGATLPPIQINQPAGSTVPGIQITNGDTVVNIGGAGGGGGGGGGIDLGDIEFPDQEPGDAEEATPPPALNPISLHGLVLNKVGGNVYKVRCWAKNPAAFPPIGVLDVEFPGLDPSDTLPSGVLRTPVIMFPKLVLNVIQPDKAIGYVAVFLTPEA